MVYVYKIVNGLAAGGGNRVQTVREHSGRTTRQCENIIKVDIRKTKVAQRSIMYTGREIEYSRVTQHIRDEKDERNVREK